MPSAVKNNCSYGFQIHVVMYRDDPVAVPAVDNLVSHYVRLDNQLPTYLKTIQFCLIICP